MSLFCSGLGVSPSQTRKGQLLARLGTLNAFCFPYTVIHLHFGDFLILAILVVKAKNAKNVSPPIFDFQYTYI